MISTFGEILMDLEMLIIEFTLILKYLILIPGISAKLIEFLFILR